MMMMYKRIVLCVLSLLLATTLVRSSVPVVLKEDSTEENLSVIQKLQQIADETIERISRVSGLRLRGNPTSPDSPTSTFIGCSSVTNCGDCISEIGCGWCESTATCISSSNEAPDSCPSAAWRRASCENICSASFSCDSCVGDNPVAGHNVCVWCHDATGNGVCSPRGSSCESKSRSENADQCRARVDAIKNVGMSLPSVDIMRFAERSGAHMTESQRMQVAAQMRAARTLRDAMEETRELPGEPDESDVLDFAASSSAEAYRMLQNQRSTVRPSSLLEIRERRRSRSENLQPEQSAQISRLMNELNVGDDDFDSSSSSSSSSPDDDGETNKNIDNDLIVVNAADVDDLPPCPEGADCGPVVNLNKIKREKMKQDSVVVAKAKAEFVQDEKQEDPPCEEDDCDKSVVVARSKAEFVAQEPPCDDCSEPCNGGEDCDGTTGLGPKVATCFDELQNGDEEGVDCGGSCPRLCGEVIAPDIPGLTPPTDTYHPGIPGTKPSNEAERVALGPEASKLDFDQTSLVPLHVGYGQDVFVRFSVPPNHEYDSHDRVGLFKHPKAQGFSAGRALQWFPIDGVVDAGGVNFNVLTDMKQGGIFELKYFDKNGNLVAKSLPIVLQVDTTSHHAYAGPLPATGAADDENGDELSFGTGGSYASATRSIVRAKTIEEDSVESFERKKKKNSKESASKASGDMGDRTKKLMKRDMLMQHVEGMLNDYQKHLNERRSSASSMMPSSTTTTTNAPPPPPVYASSSGSDSSVPVPPSVPSVPPSVPSVPPSVPSKAEEEQKDKSDNQIAFGMEAFLNDLSQEHPKAREAVAKILGLTNSNENSDGDSTSSPPTFQLPLTRENIKKMAHAAHKAKMGAVNAAASSSPPAIPAAVEE